MKKLLIIFIGLFTACSANRTIINSEQTNILPFNNEREVKMSYVGSSNYLIRTYTGEKIVIDGKEYYKQLTQYSWGNTSTSYFREENGNIYSYDMKSETENLQIPREIKVGYSWVSSDGAWAYQITETNARLKTPKKKYKNLIVIKATQLTNRDKNKKSEYFNYYKIGFGQVASFADGELMTYLIEQ